MKVTRLPVTSLLLAAIVLAFGERCSTELASPIQAAYSTSYSTFFSTQASTKISYGPVATATSTAYITIYSTAYYRQSDPNGPLVRVKGWAAITPSGYTASVSATVENLFDDYIFKISVTFQVMLISKDGRRLPTRAGAKLLFDGGIWPGGSRSPNDVFLIQYRLGNLGQPSRPICQRISMRWSSLMWISLHTLSRALLLPRPFTA